MTSPLRSITVVDAENTQINIDNLVGVDESADSGSFVIVAVRCTREDDIALVRALVESELQPFRHKSSSIVRYGELDRDERVERVESLLSKLGESSITWAAITCSDNPSNRVKAAAATMAAKKSITNGLQSGNVSHGCGNTALLHDGQYDDYSDYFDDLRTLVSGHFDSGFQRSICPVYLTFLQDADRTYPQNNTADYIAGYLRDQIQHGSTDTLPEQVSEFDQSWLDSAPQPEPVYHLPEFDPIREEDLRSRVIAWLTGKRIPQDRSPTTRDPYRTLIEQIDDTIVYQYLSEEI